MTTSIYTPEMLALTAWLKAARLERGLSMRALGEALEKPHTYIQKVESGERRLDVVEFVWYCRALGVEPADGLAVLERAAQLNLYR